MNCKIGDYVTDKFDNIFHIRGEYERVIINVNDIAVRYATDGEIKRYHGESEKMRSGDE